MFEHFNKPIIITGANASGKTAISLSIAHKIGAEIISADSRQIYKHLSAGTSKPHGRWVNNENPVYIVDMIPYHLVDFIDPKETYNAQRYFYDFNGTLNKIKTKQVIICGGTGFYINSIFNPLDPLPQANEKIRTELKEYADKYGREKLHKKLIEIDPVAAKKIHYNNINRVIRAIEVSIMTSKPYSSLISDNTFKRESYFKAFFVFIKWDKNLLYKRIRERTKNVFDDWVNETKNLILNGYTHDCPGLKSLGYPVIIEYISQSITKDYAIDIITKQSMDYAKRQNTWFNRYPSLKIDINDQKDFDIEKITKDIIEKYESSCNSSSSH
ncbi:MAG: tRNA (adenosine(37)-N6)-dimethylallyltransferase MiaA [Elusimicrobiales bacterium]|nr:tRNA (adenosine(37)-N6)-dimethylallyltransferase MiaA [Elusimicrobiales bacterium]